jgi:transposase
MSADEDLFAERRGEVLRLTYAENLGIRAISRRLKIARKTVRSLLDGDRATKKAAATPRTRMLDRYDGAIRQILGETPGMLAPAMLERLRTLGYRGGLTIVRARLRQLRPHAQKEPFLTLNFKAGAAAQVDWADFGFALPGCTRRVSAFVMVMCYSRQLYLEFTLSQAMGSFLRCMERALHFFWRQHNGRHLRQHEDRGEVAHAHRHGVQSEIPGLCPCPRVRCRGLQRRTRQ